MNNCFIILAAGESKRFNSKIPKSYHLYNGKPLILHSIDKAKQSKKFNKIVVVINKKHKKFIKNLNIKNISIIDGGKTRAESSYKALQSIKKYNISKVFIHDAARPNFSLNLINNLFKQLKFYKCVVPALKATDSVKLKNGKKFSNLNKNDVYLTQTPQAFNFQDIYELQKNKNKSVNITDDSNLFISSNKKIKIIKGENKNYKITFDLDLTKNNLIKYGIGFDVHRLVPKRKLYLGGIIIPFKLGTLGHSDGDPVLHAIIDSILGACEMGDIGENFSDKNKQFKNIRSNILLKEIINKIKLKNYSINNIDINIIAQKPNISKFKNKIIQSISKICEISNDQINIKGKTTEKLGLIGKEKAIACEVITSVIKYD